jgi:hypothetical protein
MRFCRHDLKGTNTDAVRRRCVDRDPELAPRKGLALATPDVALATAARAESASLTGER